MNNNNIHRTSCDSNQGEVLSSFSLYFIYLSVKCVSNLIKFPGTGSGWRITEICVFLINESGKINSIVLIINVKSSVLNTYTKFAFFNFVHTFSDNRCATVM